jgi:hypothetical protein
VLDRGPIVHGMVPAGGLHDARKDTVYAVTNIAVVLRAEIDAAMCPLRPGMPSR